MVLSFRGSVRFLHSLVKVLRFQRTRCAGTGVYDVKTGTHRLHSSSFLGFMFKRNHYGTYGK